MYDLPISKIKFLAVNSALKCLQDERRYVIVTNGGYFTTFPPNGV